MTDGALVPALSSPPELPLVGVAGEIAEVIGRAKTCRLIEEMRGSTGRSWRVCIYVPKRLHLDHDLVRILGWKDARRLSAAFGGEILQTSNLRYLERNWRAWGIHQLHRVKGLAPAEIADQIGLSVSRVREILRGNPPEGMPARAGQNGSGEVA
ncbi:hypothetical protein T8A63_15180 [Sulfitobacter sp. OXR-159]|uniref:hypothetical protein n=1 Tax=Sulfitobacter sp. OXR-159 TaxID=3100174 RepID=UPI002AC9172A|nr:hypothetical protein [Sulfitobacter sp. OXR-159]WPZ28956.1 hypothetical protein T8A63_15180 [Sulfitobacter sp. OXR-159]